MPLLTQTDIDRRLADLPAWSQQGDAIVTRLAFATFRDAIAFVVRLAFDAEDADHHPDLTISYRRVTVSYSTHSEGGLTQKDFDGAATTDRLVAAMAATRNR